LEKRKKIGLSGEGLTQYVLKELEVEEERQNRKEEWDIRKAELAARKEESERQEQIRKEELAAKKEELARQEQIRKEQEERQEQIRKEDLAAKKEQEERQDQIRREEVEARREENERREERHDRKELQEGVHGLLEPLTDKDDVDSYLSHFERLAAMNRWKESTWAPKIVSLLRGGARDAVMRLEPGQISEYQFVKKTLLKHFRLDADSYRRKFRTMRKEAEESFCQFLARLRTCFSRWCMAAGKDEDVAEDIKDMMLQEQFYNVLSAEYVTEVKRTSPTTAEEVADEANKLAMARRAGRELGASKGNTFERAKKSLGQGDATRDTAVERGVSHDKPRTGHSQGTVPQSNTGCFNCGQSGHIARECRRPQRVRAITVRDRKAAGKVATLCNQCAKKQFIPRCHMMVNGQPVEGIRDTGSEQTVVARKLVSADAYTGRQVDVVLADSCSRYTLLEAVIELESPFLQGRIRVLVMERPTDDILIGNHIQREGSLESEEVPVFAVDTGISAVTTRGQEGRKQTEKPLVVQGIDLDVSPTDLIKQQSEDETLTKARKAAVSKERISVRSGEVRFGKKEGILIRKFQGKGSTATQICVPKELRTKVMSLAHDAPLAGHLAVARTQNRLIPHFYWPGMFADIRRFCQSCVRCQKTTQKGRVKKVPLVSMPLIRVPFQRVGVDIIGPIKPRSRSGKAYILVMVDCATRYPEATPLKDITTEAVAEALFTMWTRTGIPEEVLSDRGTQFVSRMMEEVHKLMAIKGLRTTAYHPQCNGLVERFNGTLKTMLRRLTGEKPEEWDRWIPALLFAYREVPQESTGFAPFELLYGRTVRGPMQILKDSWLHPEEPELQTMAGYVMNLRDRITGTCEIAEQELEKASYRHKKYFDKTAEPRSFKEGSRVLVLRPTKANRLELEWRGPYPVETRAGPVDYVIKVNGKEKRYHANLLKQFVEREPAKIATVVIEDGEPEWETTPTVSKEIPVIPLIASEGPRDVHIGNYDDVLTAEIKELVLGYPDVLTDLPLCTSLETCSIKVSTDKPVRTRQYPIPYTQRETIKEEVEAMLAMGAIEPSVSAYGSPIVLVKKKDGRVRFCVDYRKLNKIVEFDAEPMPEIEYLFAKLGKKGIFSKIDLAKGYWQIPVEEEDRPKTAFSTPEGHFQWKVMPFGLCTSGAVFSRMMRKLIQPLKSEDVDNFIDDILIATETTSEHIKALEAVFQRLRDCSLSAKPSKCELGCAELDYLGHRIKKGEIRPDEEKMERIKKVPLPSSKKQLRGFLGLTGYYRKFIPSYAEIAYPLTELTKLRASNHTQWNEEAKGAFETLKGMFCEAPVCILPDPQQPFVIRTDASEIGLGAILLQDHGKGLQPVACASKKLSGAEKNYPIIEKECLAIVWGIHRFEQYLYGREFTIQTDHSPLRYLDSMKSTSGRLTRWALQLQPFNYAVQVIPGKDNLGADFLSRIQDE
jgi:hypothetical protein